MTHHDHQRLLLLAGWTIGWLKDYPRWFTFTVLGLWLYTGWRAERRSTR